MKMADQDDIQVIQAGAALLKAQQTAGPHIHQYPGLAIVPDYIGTRSTLVIQFRAARTQYLWSYPICATGRVCMQ
jgi:hypothetical protein